MKIRNEIRPLEKMQPMGKVKGQDGQGSQTGQAGKMGGMNPNKVDTYAISPRGREAIAPETSETSQSNQITPNITVGTGESVAGSFTDPADYLAYLTDTYPSITNSNITMSEKTLMQAMTDPEKEKVLTQFLTDMDGAADYRASEVAGLNDGTYAYEMEHYSIHIDFIAEDNSGVVGGDWTVISVAREDGEPMGRMEFGDVKKGVIEYFHEIHQEQYGKHEEMWTAFIEKQLELKEKQLEKMDAERQEAKQAERREERAPTAKVSLKENPEHGQYSPARVAAMATEPKAEMPSKGTQLSAEV